MKRLITLLSLATFLAMGFQAGAQSTGNYSFSTVTTGSLTDMSSGTNSLISGGSDSGVSPATDIGFTFIFMGVPYTQFTVSANGLLRLGSTAVGGTTYAVAQASQALIGPFVRDLYVTASGKVHYKITGTAPNRILIVEWLNMRIDYYSSTVDGTYQARIYESTGVIEFVYGAMSVGTGGTTTGYSLGISSSNTDSYYSTITTSTNTVNTTGGAVTNTYTAGATIPNLNSSSDGSRRVYTFTPPAAPTAPSGLNFTGITQSSMTLNWTDNSSNETGFAIYRSTDGVNYTLISITAANAISYAATGLIPSQTYYWTVYAINEGAISSGTSNSQTTNSAGNITSTGSGNWNSTTPDAPWPGGVVPGTYDNVTIADGHTVTINVTDTCYSLTVGQGTSGTLTFDGTARTMNVMSFVSVAAGGSFNAGSANITHALTIGGLSATSSFAGNLTANGTMDFYVGASNGKCNITFFGGQNATVTGSGVLDFNSITLNKGAVTASTSVTPPILDFQTGFTVQGANTVGLVSTHTAGTLKFSGSFSLSTPLYVTLGYSIPSLGGVWLNNPNFTAAGQGGSPTNNGLFKVTSGTYNIGTGTGNSLGSGTNSVYIIEGGNVNATGRINLTSTGVNYNQSGGNVSVTTITSSSSSASFGITSTTSTFTMSGGNIYIVNNGTTVDYNVASSTTNITGGTLQLGTASSGTAKTFRLQGTTPNVILDNTSANHSCTLSGSCIVKGNLTINGTGTFSLSTLYTLDMRGMNSSFPGNIVNNGTLTLNAGTSQNLTFSSSFGNQSLTNNGTISGPNQLGNLNINNTFGGAGTVTIPNGLIMINGSTLTMTKGTLNVGTGMTLGNAGSSLFSVIMSGGVISGPLTFNFGTGTVGYTYNAATPQTTGAELPSSISGTLTINNTSGVTLNAPLSAGFLTLTAGALNTTSTNLLTVTTSTAAAVSRTSGYVNGPLARTLPLTSATGTWTYPLGTATNYLPWEIVDPVTGAVSPVIKVEMTEGSYSGTPGTLLSAVNNNRRWAATLVSGNFTNSKLKITDPSVDATKTIATSASINGVFNGTPSTNASTTLSTMSAITLDNYYAVGTKAPMSYVSSTATQTVFTDILQGATNQQIIGIQVVTTGSDSPLTMDSFTFNTNGSTNGTNNLDIVNAKLYSTGTSSTFATTTQVGSTVTDFTTGSGVFTVSPVAFNLADGTNYFWLTFDIQGTATNNNIVDAECTSLSVSGSAKTPSVTAPAGSRAIFTPVTTVLFTENFESAWTIPSTIDTAGWSCPQTGNNEWHRNDNTTGWTNSSGSYTPAGAISTSYSARFHSYDATSGTIGELITPTIDFSTASNTKKLNFYYINTSGSDSLRIYFSTDDGGTWTKLQQINTASSWTLYTVVLGNSTSNQCKVKFTGRSDYGYTDIGLDQIKIYDVSSPTMRYFSCTTTQSVTSSVNAGAMNQQIIGIQVVTAGEANPISLTKFTVNANGSTNVGDADTAKIYYTGTSSTFATTTLFGSKYPNPTSSNFNITGTQQLLGGTNYFWLTYDIDSAAVNNNFVDGECSVVTVGGSDKTPSTTAPVGNRQIVQKTFTSLTVNQASTDVVGAGTPNNPILRLDFVVAGPSSGKILLNNILVTSTSTSDADIAASGVKLYRTTSTTFSTTNQVGSAQSLSGGTATFSSLNYNLPSGTTYIWVTYDVAASATENNILDAKIVANSVTVAGSTYPSSPQDPTGNRIIKLPIAGVKTIGTGGNYTSLTRSDGIFSSINAVGLSGNLIINIISDLTSEDGSVALNQWSESGAGNYTITIQPNSASERLISGNASANMIRFNGADRVTIDGRFSGTGNYLRFRNDNSSYTTFEISNGAVNNTIRNSYVEGANSSSTSGVIYFGSGVNTNNYIRECEIRDLSSISGKPYNCIYLNSTDNNYNNIINSKIYNFTNDGIYLSSCTNTLIDSCNFYMTSASTASTIYGIYIGNANGTRIAKNYFHDIYGTSSSTVKGIYYYGVNGTAMTATLENNVISLSPNTTGIVAGIDYFAWAANSANIYYNSVYLGGTVTSGSNATNCYTKRDAATTFDFKNNIAVNALSNSGGTGAHYAIYVNNTVGTITMNYNDYYTSGTGGVLGYWGTTAQSTLANWQTASSQDANSLNVDPVYTDALLHLNQLTSPVIGKALVLGSVTTDYSNKTRHPLYPTIGAHEYAPILTWTGTANTSWNDIGNWIPGIIPDGTYWVVVPTAPVGGNFPAVPNGVTAVCYGITVETGATLNVQNGGTLDILNP